MDNLLNNFQNDEQTREAVHTFILDELNKYALDLVYDKKDASHIADAKEVISQVFIELGEQFSKEVKKDNPNSAR